MQICQFLDAEMDKNLGKSESIRFNVLGGHLGLLLFSLNQVISCSQD